MVYDVYIRLLYEAHDWIILIAKSVKTMCRNFLQFYFSIGCKNINRTRTKTMAVKNNVTTKKSGLYMLIIIKGSLL